MAPDNPCEVSHHCKNAGACCDMCIGSYLPEEWESADCLRLYYSTDRGAPVHPFTTWQKEQKRAAKRARKASPAFKEKSRMVRKALKTEKSTRSALVRATLRSGALNGDGDTRIADGSVGVDDKFYSKARTQFTVKVEDIDKAWAQKQCILVITLADNRKFAVAELEHLAYVATLLDSKPVDQTEPC